MDARFLGFSVDFESEKLTLDGLMEMLSSKLAHQMSEDKGTGNSRILYFDDDHHEDFYLGMVVTVRNQKKFCRGKQVESGRVRARMFTFCSLINSSEKLEQLLDNLCL